MIYASTDTVPARSLQQRMDALSRANQVRIYRAELKVDIKMGHAHILDVLKHHENYDVGTMKIRDLLMAVPKMGETKVNKLLRLCKISPSKTMDGMTDRQLNELVYLLGKRM